MSEVPRWRRVIGALLVVVGCVLVPISLSAVWVRNTLLDTDHYVSTVGPLASNAQIQQALEISPGTVARVRKRCVQAGVQEAILPARAQRVRSRRLDGTQEAYLIALVCSAPPGVVCAGRCAC